MSASVPVVIVTLPATTVRGSREEVDAAADAGAGLAEVRLDRWAPEELARAHELFPSRLPLVATLRSRAEGGFGPDDPNERARIFQALLGLPFRFVDIESERDLPESFDRPRADPFGWIVSYHRVGGVSTEAFARRVREVPPVGGIRKVVVGATVLQALRDLLPALPPPGEVPLVAHTVGPSGGLLRALAGRLGFPFVYASLPEPTARGPRSAVEPSQLPVDRLLPFLRAPHDAPLFALLGHPVEHSRSPSLHSRWMEGGGRPGIYLTLDVGREEEFLEVLPLLGDWGFRGLNVTHPFKGAALHAASEIAPGAEACGAANCLTLRNGTISAENTDLAAILRRLEELRAEGRWSGRSLTVLGTGGSARATLAAARALGAERRLCGRRPTVRDELARQFGATVTDSVSAGPEEVVVHATDVGRAGTGPIELPLERLLGPGTLLLDWVYDPEIPTLREAAQRAHAFYEDGRRLLIYQAAASFGVWWGEEPTPQELARTLREEGCAA